MPQIRWAENSVVIMALVVSRCQIYSPHYNFPPSFMSQTGSFWMTNIFVFLLPSCTFFYNLWMYPLYMHCMWYVCFCTIVQTKMNQKRFLCSRTNKSLQSKKYSGSYRRFLNKSPNEFLYGSLVHLNHRPETREALVHWFRKGAQNRRQGQMKIHKTLTLLTSIETVVPISKTLAHHQSQINLFIWSYIFTSVTMIGGSTTCGLPNTRHKSQGRYGAHLCCNDVQNAEQFEVG